MTSIASGVSLSAAVNSNLLSLQNTQSLISQTQLRLATGLKVNSATDNPESFFTAKAFSSRAAALSAALDKIKTNLGTINQANSAITSLQTLITSAQGIANSAQGVLGGTLTASITGNRSLTNINNLTTVSGITANDRIRFRFVDSTGAVNSASSVSIAAGQSVNTFMNNINAIADVGSQVFQASLNSAGQLTISRTNNTRFDIQFENNAGAASAQTAAALGFGGYTTTNTLDGTAQTRISVLPTPALNTNSLFAVGGTAAQASTIIRNVVSTSAAAAGDIFNGDSGDKISISVNGGSYVTLTSNVTTDTLQTLIDGINNNATVNTQIAASFDSGSSQLNIRAISDKVTSIQLQLTEDPAAAGTGGKIDFQKLGFGTFILASADGDSKTSSESFQLNSTSASLADYEAQYNSVLTQIDKLASDSSFNGVNLLNGQSLTTYFNEDNSTSLTIQGDTLSSTGLGISQANFGSSSNVSNAVSQISSATSHVKNFASGLSNDISIIQTRQNFAENTINTLNQGASDLTASDQNEDGAQLLALQTRLLLGVTGLALASQSQASVLRLF